MTVFVAAAESLDSTVRWHKRGAAVHYPASRLDHRCAAQSQPGPPEYSGWGCVSSSMGIFSVAEPFSIWKRVVYKNSAAADGQHSFGGTERRLHKDLGRVTRLIGFLIGISVTFSCSTLRDGGCCPPLTQRVNAALILASQFIRHDGGDLVTSTEGSLKGTGARLGRGEKRAGLNINHLLRSNSPLMYFHSNLPAVISTGRFAIGLPSRSVTMKSTLSGVPLSTK